MRLSKIRTKFRLYGLDLSSHGEEELVKDNLCAYTSINMSVVTGAMPFPSLNSFPVLTDILTVLSFHNR